MQLIHGDCLEKMKDIPDKSIDMILCDLPYGTTACKWDVVIPFEPLWAQYKRIIKDRGAIVLFGSQPFTTVMINSNIRLFHHSWVWAKRFAGNYAQAKTHPQKVHEDIAVFGDRVVYYPQKTQRDTPIKKGKNAGGNIYGGVSGLGRDDYVDKIYTDKYPESILYYSSRSDVRIHPTQKPVALLEYLIKTYTHKGETVLDNCMGSGSTGVACINTNRNFIGIEKDDKYFEIAKKRIADTVKDASTMLF